VQAKADDEIGMLVESFNKMTEDLGRGKAELTRPTRTCSNPTWNWTAVATTWRRFWKPSRPRPLLDAEGRVNTVNHAAARMLGQSPEAILHRPYAEVFEGYALQPLRHLVSRVADGGREVSDQTGHLTLNSRPATLMVTCSGLRPGAERRGSWRPDDISEVIRAQQALAGGRCRRIAPRDQEP